MSHADIRRRFNRRLTGLTRYTKPAGWALVLGYLGQAGLGVVLGHYLLSLELSWASAVGMAAVAVFIGTRLRGLNNIVHECSHSSFCEVREDNVAIGRFCSAVLTGSFRKYKEDHLSHHMYLGDYERDNELSAIEKFGLHDPLTVRTVLRHISTPLLGRHLLAYSGINLSGEDGKVFFALKLALLAAIMVFAMFEPLTALIFVVLPLFYIFPTLNFWTDCLDHAGLVGETDELRASRNVLAPGMIRLLFFPRNDCYHLVHHLFPQVPARHLANAHHELCADPEYAGQPQAVGSGLFNPEADGKPA